MPTQITHSFVSVIPDNPAAVAAGKVVPSNWNDDHVVDLGAGNDKQVLYNAVGAIVSSPFFTFDNAQMAIGNASALGGGSLYGNYPPIILDIEATYTVDPPSGYVTGQVVYINADFGAPSTAGVDGGVFNAANATANAVQYVNGFTASAYGLATQTVIGGNFFGTGTGATPSVYGLGVTVGHDGSGTTTSSYALQLNTQNTGGGAITNAYGLYIYDHNVASNNWAIKTGLGKVQFGDNVILGTVSSKTGVLQFANASSANLTSFQAGNAAAAITYTLPTNVGAAGTVLTDAAGNGTLSWAAASGTGTVTSVSVVTANGFSGSVATATTTPAITLTMQNAAADGATKGVAAFTAADFDAASGVISIDYTNGQKATGSVPGFLSATDWTTFNGKGNAQTANPLSQFAATTSAQLAGVISDETGSGLLVFATTPTLTTPILGVATATSVNKMAITAPATSSTLAVADGKTLTASNTITLTGTDGVSANVSNLKLRQITGFIGDGVNTIATNGATFAIPCVFAGTITAYTIAVDAGTCTIKTCRKATGTAIPTISDSISTSGVAISTGTLVRSTTVSDFTSTTVTANDVFVFIATAVATAKYISFTLEITST